MSHSSGSPPRDLRAPHLTDSLLSRVVGFAENVRDTREMLEEFVVACGWCNTVTIPGPPPDMRVGTDKMGFYDPLPTFDRAAGLTRDELVTRDTATTHPLTPDGGVQLWVGDVRVELHPDKGAEIHAGANTYTIPVSVDMAGRRSECKLANSAGICTLYTYPPRLWMWEARRLLERIIKEKEKKRKKQDALAN